MRRDEALKHPFTHMETEQPKTAEVLADNGVVQIDDTIDEQMINGPPYKCTGLDARGMTHLFCPGLFKE